MSRINYFFDTYTLDAFHETLKQASAWDVKDLNKYKENMYRLERASINDLRNQTLNQPTNGQRLQYIDDQIKKFDSLVEQLAEKEDEFSKCLHQTGIDFLNDARILKQSVSHFPITETVSEVTTSLQKSSYQKPVAFFSSLVRDAVVNEFREEFYDNYSKAGYSIDETNEAAFITEYYNDTDDLDWESLSTEELAEYSKLRESSSREITETVKFSDDLLAECKKNVIISQELIKGFLIHQLDQEKNYLKRTLKELKDVISSPSSELKKYPMVLKTIKSFYQSLINQRGDIKLDHIPLNVPPDGNLTFEVGSVITEVSPDFLLDFHAQLEKRHVDCYRKDIVRVFRGPRIDQRVQWLGTDQELFFLINHLVETNKIKTKSPKHGKWQVVKNCFLNRKGRPYDSNRLRLTKNPPASKKEAIVKICLSFD